MAIRVPIVSEFNPKGIASAQEAFRKFGNESYTSLERVGGRMRVVGDEMTKKVTLPLIAAGIGAGKLASDFDTSFAKIQGLVGVAKSDLGELKQGVLDLSGETAKSPRELAEALFTVTSAGFRGREALNVLESAARASAAGMGETNTIAQALTGAVNAYGPAVLDAGRATEILVATARAGNFESSQLAGSLGRILPIAKEAEASFEDVGGAIALLTRVNNDATQSGTQVTAMLRAFAIPTAQTTQLLSEMGLTAGDVRKMIGEQGLVATLQHLDQELGGNRETLGRIIGSSEGAAAAFQILNADAATIADTFGGVKNSTGIVDEAFDAMADTAGFKARQALANLEGSMISAGDVLLPIAAQFLEFGAKVAGVFSSLPAPVQTFTVGLLGVAAAAGPLLSIGGRMVENWGKLTGATRAADAANKSAAVSTGVLSRAMIALRTAMINHPILAFVTVAAGVAAAIALIGRSSDDTTERVKGLAAAMRDAGSAAGGLESKLTDLVTEHQVWADVLDHADIKVGELADAVAAGGDELEVMRGRVRDAAEELGFGSTVAGWFADNLDQMAGDAQKAAAHNETLGSITAERLTPAVEEATAAHLEFARGMRDVTENTEDAADATEEKARIDEFARQAVENHRRALEDQKRALEDVMSASRSLIDTRWRHRDAEEKTAEAIWASVEASNNAETTAHEQEQAYRDVERAALDQAVAASEMASQQAEANGETLSSAEALQIQADELRSVAETLRPGDPLRTRLMEYVAEIQLIPTEANTVVNVDTSTAQQRLDRLINSFAALRQSEGFRGVGQNVGTAPTPGAATGTPFSGTDLIVGEDGAERVRLPRGSQVDPAWRTDEQMRTGGSSGPLVHIDKVETHNGTDVTQLAAMLSMMMAVSP